MSVHGCRKPQLSSASLDHPRLHVQLQRFSASADKVTLLQQRRRQKAPDADFFFFSVYFSLVSLSDFVLAEGQRVHCHEGAFTRQR